MVDSLTIVPYNTHTDGDVYLSGVIDCYQKSFAGPPWNESHVCPKCSKSFGSEVVGSLQVSDVTYSCPDCSVELSLFWPYEVVKHDFLSETTEDLDALRHPSSWVALISEEVVGICWGYTITPIDLEKKVNLPDLEKKISMHFGADLNMVAYQDELAVLPEWRGIKIDGKTIARRLVESRHKDFLRFGAQVGIIRTLKYPPTRTYQWYTQVGFTEIASYADNPNRVILGREYSGLSY